GGLVLRRGWILRVRVFRVIGEAGPPAVDVGVELGGQPLDRLDLVLLGVDDERVRASLGDDERPSLLAGAWLPRCGRRAGQRGGRDAGLQRRHGRRAGRGRRDAAAREELVQDVREGGGVRERDRGDLELLLRHLHV